MKGHTKNFKLSIADVERVLELFLRGYKPQEIADEFGVSRNAINYHVKKNEWIREEILRRMAINIADKLLEDIVPRVEKILSEPKLTP